MPKQSGIYKLKGKLDGLSYYRQSGVDSQLVRRINTAMSSRVKTSDEFANTRRNNVEFGGAADVAKLLGAAVQPKFRPMFLNFSQSKLTKDILEMVKASTGDWGQRAVTAANTPDMLASLNSLSKIDFRSTYGILSADEGATSGQTEIDLIGTRDQVAALQSLGVDGVDFKVITYQLLTGKYNNTLGKIENGRLTPIASQIESNNFGEDEYTAFTVNIAAEIEGITPPPTFVLHSICVVVALPYRKINNVKYTLQEYCSFDAVECVIA